MPCSGPAPASSGRAALTSGKIVADFMRNEGRQTRAWPDFGGARNHHGEAPGGTMPAKLRT
ncbi:MAG: hypothetical protein NTW21_06950 [Verrucomicrobia bacterium]|nr:hypothetical protein [Verrucomicrobiota bacterium]